MFKRLIELFKGLFRTSDEGEITPIVSVSVEEVVAIPSDEGETFSMDGVPTADGTHHTAFLLIRGPGKDYFYPFPDNWCLLSEGKRQEIRNEIREKTGFEIRAAE